MMEGKKLQDELKMSGFSSLYQKLLLNLMFTGSWWESRVQEVLKEFGLTEQQYNVLRILNGQKGKPLSLQAVQERMIHRMSNATRIVEKLRGKGLLEREICQENRRQVEIRITQDGKEMLDRVAPEMQKLMDRMAENLSQEELDRLHHLLEKVRGVQEASEASN